KPARAASVYAVALPSPDRAADATSCVEHWRRTPHRLDRRCPRLRANLRRREACCRAQSGTEISRAEYKGLRRVDRTAFDASGSRRNGVRTYPARQRGNRLPTGFLMRLRTRFASANNPGLRLGTIDIHRPPNKLSACRSAHHG